MLSNWDSELRKENRKIPLLVDNCTSHPNINELLTNIKLVFLPPNTTAKIQPMDAGVIKNFKYFYKKKLLTNIIKHLEDDCNVTIPKITIFDALELVENAWECVTETTIRNCFRHAGFVLSEIEHMASTEPSENMFEKLLGNGFSFENCLTADDNLVTEGNREEDPIVESASESLLNIPDITAGDAYDSFMKIRGFYATIDNRMLKGALSKIESDLEKRYLESRKRQMKITEFIFKK